MNIKNNKNCKITINDEEVEKYTIKPETADKMFEKLGYKKYCSLQTCRYVRYCNIVNGEKEYIIFLKNKTVRFQYLYTHVSKNITMEELQAINKKCKELRLDMIETETGKVLNKLAREQFKSKLLAEILIDLQVCKLENLNPKEYIEELKQEIDNIYERFNNENE